jgi:hypothetical protein
LASNKKTAYALKKEFNLARATLNECIVSTTTPELKGLAYNNLAVVSWLQYRQAVKAGPSNVPDFDSIREGYENCWNLFGKSLEWIESRLTRILCH